MKAFQIIVAEPEAFLNFKLRYTADDFHWNPDKHMLRIEKDGQNIAVFNTDHIIGIVDMTERAV